MTNDMLAKGRISAVIVGMINVGIVLILIGLWMLGGSDSVADYRGYEIVIVTFATMSLIFSVYAMVERYLTAGMFFLITFLAAIITLIVRKTDDTLLNSLVYIALAYAMCAVIFHKRGETVLTATSALAAVSLIIDCILDTNNGFTSAIMLVAGTLTLLSGCLSLASIGPSWMRVSIVTVENKTSIDYPTTITYTAGTFVSCIVLFTIGVNNSDHSLMVFKLIIAVMSVFAGLYGILYGSHKRGIDLVVLAIFSINGAVGSILGIGGISYLNIVLILPLLSSAALEYRSNEPLKCVCTLLYATTITINTLFGVSEIFTIIVLLTKIIATYDCLSTWYIFETGHVPKIARYNKGGVTFND